MTSISQTSQIADRFQDASRNYNTESVSPAQNAEPNVEVAQEIKLQSANPAEKNADGKNEEQNCKASNEAIKDAVSKINRESENTEAIFGIHDKTNRVTIKIVDKETRKVIKEFPPEKTLDLIAKAWEMAGIMVDEKR